MIVAGPLRKFAVDFDKLGRQKQRDGQIVTH